MPHRAGGLEADFPAFRWSRSLLYLHSLPWPPNTFLGAISRGPRFLAGVARRPWSNTLSAMVRCVRLGCSLRVEMIAFNVVIVSLLEPAEDSNREIYSAKPRTRFLLNSKTCHTARFCAP